MSVSKKTNRVISPLVKSIAQKEGVSNQELNHIDGTGENGRLLKKDLLSYLDNRVVKKHQINEGAKQNVSAHGDTVIEMDDKLRAVAQSMVRSKQISPHMTSMVETDVTNIVKWRNRAKKNFNAREGYNLTYLPLFIEAAAKALHDFPRINASVDGNRIILKKKINIGVTVSLPDGGIAVPVIKNIEEKNLLGITHELNRLITAARNNQLTDDDISDGTFSITNFGSFNNVMGTPIINQPQVAIMATGAIEKKPAVMETPSGDVIAIRSKMFLSLSYDHRVVDAALGGDFIHKVGGYLANFNVNQVI